jgi:hypothetical protein
MEQPTHVFCRYARAGVLDFGQQAKSFCLLMACTNTQNDPTSLGELYGIPKEVDEHLP